MPANVETMAYLGAKPWHDLGVAFSRPMTAHDALEEAGLGWTVQPELVYLGNGLPVPNVRANVRTSDGSVLGVVSDQYQLVQNTDLADLMDHLVDAGLIIETAGSLDSGKQVWMAARLPEAYHLAGDETTVYLTATNGHDGRHAVRVFTSLVRVVCQNTLNWAWRSASRSWIARHAGSVEGKMEDAREALGWTQVYLDRMQESAERLANTPMTEEDWTRCVEAIFPTQGLDVPPSALMQARHDILSECLFEDTLDGIRWSALGAMNAVADFRTHYASSRAAKDAPMRTFLENDPWAPKVLQTLRVSI